MPLTGAALFWARVRFAWVAIGYVFFTLLVVPFYYILGYPFPRFFYRYVQAWTHILADLCGARIYVKGLSRPDWDLPSVIVMNHLSYLDFAVAMQVVPVHLHIIATRGLGFVPFIGGAMRLMQFIFIDRKSPAKAYASMEKASEKIAMGRHVLSYPEGGISKTGEMGSFKRGLFHLAVRAQVPVVPFVIRGSHLVMDNWKKTVVPGDVEVEFLAPEPTAGLDESDLPALIERVRTRMAAAYGDGTLRGEGFEMAESPWSKRGRRL
ncbi:MAG: 1-acyl-sn-glycerol-3-phosphate acyltransferase [Deltaproteobacteria bacterium]|nr:1-acyl-sn-glycerol-3-phosphate acyltransferase [Deltaproteobacteria bacterium]